MDLPVIIYAIWSYLLGSVPTGLIAGQVLCGQDIRQGGSGNIGATNAARLLGKRVGLLTLAGDILKGYLPALAGVKLLDSLPLACLLGLLAFLGHIFPVYLRFKGGKGVATALGVMLFLAPAAVAWSAAVFVAAVCLCRRVSLSSLAAVAAAPAVLAFSSQPLPVKAISLAMALLIFVQHRSNIARLLSGTEDRIGTKN